MNPGIYPACITPFENGRIATDKIAHNVARWEQAGVHGYVILGSTGEYVYLDEDERAAVIEAARKAIPRGKTMLVGTGHEATRTTVHYTKQAAELGADAALVVTPVYYTRGKEDALRRHYLDVAEASPLPILIYNVPPFTAYNMPVDLVAKLAEHPNIVGMKDSAGDVGQLADLLRVTPPTFALFTGSARVVYPALCLGVRGAILAAANPLGREFVQLYDLWRAGQHDAARQWQLKLRGVEKAIGAHGIPGWKAAMEARGFYGGRPRPPLLPVGEVAQEQIRRAMQGL